MGHKTHEGRGNPWFGLTLIVVGLFFLLERFELFDLGDLPSGWYFGVAMLFGVAHMVSTRTAEGVGNGLTWVLLLLWVWACTKNWYDLTWGNSWPVALAVVGLGMVIESRPFGSRRRRACCQPHCKLGDHRDPGDPNHESEGRHAERPA